MYTFLHLSIFSNLRGQRYILVFLHSSRCWCIRIGRKELLWSLNFAINFVHGIQLPATANAWKSLCCGSILHGFHSEYRIVLFFITIWLENLSYSVLIYPFDVISPPYASQQEVYHFETPCMLWWCSNNIKVCFIISFVYNIKGDQISPLNNKPFLTLQLPDTFESFHLLHIETKV